jgi:hypothetical protein
MESGKGSVLPYRTDPDDMARWIEARARGRSVEQIRALGFSAKAFEGTVATADALGFVNSQNGELTETGRRFALSGPEERNRLIRDSMLDYEPYALLLEAVLLGDAPTVTDTAWIETWWASHGYGTSESNRSEAGTVFSRLVEAAGFGIYIQGRRGHPSRIEWQPGSGEFLRRRQEPGASPVQAAGSVEAMPPELTGGSDGPIVAPPAPYAPGDPAAAVCSVSIRFDNDRVAQLSVPSVLTRAEKARLLSLLDLLISVAPDP